MLPIVKKLYKFDKIKTEHKNNILQFKSEIINFFLENDIKVKVGTNGNAFYVDVKSSNENIRIPIDVLYKFCKKFDCEFDTNNDFRYIFRYNNFSENNILDEFF